MEKIGTYITVFILVMLVNHSLFATNYSVSSAFDIESLQENLQAGDTLKMTSGTWNNQQIIFEADGEKGKPIVLISEEKNGVVLSGTSTLRISGKYLEVNGLKFENGYSASGAVIEFRNGSSKLASHCRLTNCSIINYNPFSKDTDYKWVSIYGQYNRVDRCIFSGKEHSGTTLVIWLNDEPNYTQIDYNYFGKRPDLGYNGGETIRIGTSTNSMKESRAVVEYNLFEECDGEIEIISNKSCFNTYRYNTFKDCDGCLTLRHGNDCSVYANFFLGKEKASGGVRIVGERHQVYNNYFQGLKGDDYRSAICIMNGVPNSPLNRYFQVRDAVVIFNTIIDCKMPLIVGAGKDSEKSLAPLNCTLANNVIDKTSGSKNVVIKDEPTHITWLGNVVNANAKNEDVTEGFVFTNPKLVQINGLWYPSTSSVLIDAGKGDFPMVDADINGNIRDNSNDVGCHEYSNSAQLTKPLEKEDVGPYATVEEPVSGIFDHRRVKKQMVKCKVQGKSILCSVNESIHFPIKYSVFDITGRIITHGKLVNSFSSISILGNDKVLLAYFVSRQQYYQSQKFLLNSSIM